MVKDVSEQMIEFVERADPDDVDYFRAAFARRFPGLSAFEQDSAVREAIYRARERGGEELWRAGMMQRFLAETDRHSSELD